MSARVDSGIHSQVPSFHQSRATPFTAFSTLAAVSLGAAVVGMDWQGQKMSVSLCWMRNDTHSCLLSLDTWSLNLAMKSHCLDMKPLKCKHKLIRYTSMHKFHYQLCGLVNQNENRGSELLASFPAPVLGTWINTPSN